MDQLHLQEMKENLERLVQDGQLQGKKFIYLGIAMQRKNWQIYY